MSEDKKYEVYEYDQPEIIKSVRRISDGQELTVGDVITWGCGSSPDVFRTKIIGFKISKDGNIKFYHTAFGSMKIDSPHDIQKVLPQPTKKPVLFTTEDGVDVYDGMAGRICYIKPNTWDAIEILAVNYWCAGCHMPNSKEEGFSTTRKYKWFSTKEKAEEYILMNKPCLSLEDLLSVWDRDADYRKAPDYYVDAPMFKGFKELAKSKLK